MTALELVGSPRHAGGLDNVATVLGELADRLDPDALVEVARRSPVGWSQRLGYLLELVDEPGVAGVLAPFVAERANSYIPLRRALGVAGAARSPRWKVIVNVDVEPDA